MAVVRRKLGIWSRGEPSGDPGHRPTGPLRGVRRNKRCSVGHRMASAFHHNVERMTPSARLFEHISCIDVIISFPSLASLASLGMKKAGMKMLLLFTFLTTLPYRKQSIT